MAQFVSGMLPSPLICFVDSADARPFVSRRYADPTERFLATAIPISNNISLDVDGKRAFFGVSNERRKANLSQLNDNWEYMPDNELVQDVIRDLDQGGKISTLCSRCNELQLWSPTCSFSDTLAGVKETADYCALCKLLLSRCTQSHVGLDGGPIRFFRVGSSLSFGDGQGVPIASLYYTAPGTSLVHEASACFSRL